MNAFDRSQCWKGSEGHEIQSPLLQSRIMHISALLLSPHIFPHPYTHQCYCFPFGLQWAESWNKQGPHYLYVTIEDSYVSQFPIPLPSTILFRRVQWINGQSNPWKSSLFQLYPSRTQKPLFTSYYKPVRIGKVRTNQAREKPIIVINSQYEPWWFSKVWCVTSSAKTEERPIEVLNQWLSIIWTL